MPETKLYDFDTPALVEYSGLPASYWYAKKALIPHFKVARKLLWRKADIDAYLKRHYTGTLE